MPPSLAGSDFLMDPATRQALAALGASDGGTRVVGGAVRNALLGAPVADVDFATRLLPEAVIDRAERAGLEVVPTGLEHGTVTVIAGGRPFEVTTLRADVETDGRRAVVRFTEDWAEDAARRDFTMNALYCAPDGTVFDPLGGYPDIVERRVRFIGDAEDRIREDYLRILRFFRLFAWYGSGRPDPDGLRACARLKGGIAILSAERVWSELKRLFAAPDPTRAMLWMRTAAILQRALPESWGIDAIHRLVEAERSEGWPPDPLLRLESILPPHRARIDALSERLRLSRAETARLTGWAEAPEPPEAIDDTELAKAIYRTSPQAVADRIRHALAREREAGAATAVEARRHQLAFVAGWRRPVFPVSGKDLLARGMTAGPEVGRRLKELEERWIESGFSLEPAALLG
ncbi:CCA tRNA nucleotidyltransferase [Rhizobiales bacterium L72]|uniref:CCA tRNA nucleotidyltransferase n=2 Tax=Propylenella binzhouense TaxID=2555902 RepID=A0A964WS97_9HYPH|nr:CCA tRNA nucleotidyltransferase [Propylenella binzhouense]MYZ46732.1 CCA tRNA nucleotidyltransferase [Propylenella binzhouense]